MRKLMERLSKDYEVSKLNYYLGVMGLGSAIYDFFKGNYLYCALGLIVVYMAKTNIKEKELGNEIKILKQKLYGR